MIVGKISISIKDLEKHLRSVEDFCDYSDSLVPVEFRHNKAIIDNQRYLCALYIRKTNVKEWKERQRFMEQIMKTCKITGYASFLVEAGTLVNMCNKDKLKKYLRR